MSDQYMTLQEIREIPIEEYPFMVFADNIRGFFSLGVKIRTKGSYGHFMWLVGSDLLATQSWSFHLADLNAYSGCNMKFVNNPSWTEEERKIITDAIWIDLKKPWWKTLYDFPAILGQLLGLDWLQSKYHRICSECINYLALIDSEFASWFVIEHTPTPSDVNMWTKARGDRYKVKGRYSPD